MWPGPLYPYGIMKLMRVENISPNLVAIDKSERIYLTIRAASFGYEVYSQLIDAYNNTISYTILLSKGFRNSAI